MKAIDLEQGKADREATARGRGGGGAGFLAARTAGLLVSTTRGAWSVCATIVSAICAILLALAGAISAPLDDGRLASRLERLCAQVVLWVCGVSVELRGLENLDGIGACVFVANHQSLFDICATAARLPRRIRYVAKHELLGVPLIGRALRHSRHIMVNRRRGHTIREGLADSAGRYSVVVFAEGGRFIDGRVHQFKPGAAWLAIRSGMPCVPMAISGGGAVFPPGSILVRPGYAMRIAIGAPITTTGLDPGERAALTARIEADVRHLISGASSPPNRRRAVLASDGGRESTTETVRRRNGSVQQKMRERMIDLQDYCGINDKSGEPGN